MEYISQRAKSLKGSKTIAVGNAAKELIDKGIDVFNLSLGAPNIGIPQALLDSAKNAIDKKYYKYTDTAGIKQVRQMIVNKFFKDYNIEYNVSNICCSCGGKQAIFNTFACTINKEDEVILIAPYWVSYPDIVEFFGGNIKTISTSVSKKYKANASDIENSITDKTKWLIINSPNNPSGAVYTKQELTDIATVLRKYPHVNILSDDVYNEIYYTKEKPAHLLDVAPDLKERIVIINSMSKNYSGCGWRFGFVVGQKKLIDNIKKLQAQSTFHPSLVSQYAYMGTQNVSQEEMKNRIEIYKENISYTFECVNKSKNLRTVMPDGSIYLFISIKDALGKNTPDGLNIKTDIDFCEYLINEYYVAAVPGVGFGLNGYIRITPSDTKDRISKAISLIDDAYSSLTY